LVIFLKDHHFVTLSVELTCSHQTGGSCPDHGDVVGGERIR
jgi:hypothetical protein